MKKHTRKKPCEYCGAKTGSNHKADCPAISLLKDQGRGYKMKTEEVIKAPLSKNKEFLITNPPHTIFGTPSLPQSQSIIFKVGAMKEMLNDLDDDDSFRIEWFAGNKATEYSFLKK
jgi:hypothetical protein